MKPTSIWSAAFGAIVAVGACSISASPERTTEDLQVQGPPSGAGSKTDVAFTPDEVANILEVINVGEVAQGRLASQLAQSAEVRAFAMNEIVRHGRAQERAHALLGLEPSREAPHAHLKRDPTASVLLHQGEILSDDMKNQTEPRFDLAYLTAQLTEHAGMLALIDQTLLPSALARETASGTEITSSRVKEGDLQVEIEATRQELVNHLNRALRLQQALRGDDHRPR